MKTKQNDLENLLSEIKRCTACEADLPLGPNPVVRAAASAKIMIIGQAPGTRVHKTSIPWNDPSGDLLRIWMDVDRETFYNTTKIAIMPMGFCYPGKGKGGDLPPRPECAPMWHEKLMNHLPNLDLVMLVGSYAQQYYLGKPYKTLGDVVKNGDDFAPRYFPLPHPSPRNRRWLRERPWFEEEIVPKLQKRVLALLGI